MATDVIMPQMGESIAEGTITRWLVKVGDSVERDQPLFEISTDKVDAEIPSPADGVLLEIKYEEGATVPVNEVVAILGAEGEKAESGKAAAGVGVGEKAAEKDGPVAKEREQGEDARAEKGESSSAEAGGEPAAAKRREPESDAGADGVEEAERVRRFSSPVVRKMAAEHDVDIAQIEGTGIHGRVTKRDLEQYLEAKNSEPAPQPSRDERVPASAPARPAAAVSGVPAGGFSVPAYREGESVSIEPMTKIRQITAAHMRYSKDTSAHVTTVFHMDFSKVARVRERAKRGFQAAHGTKLTYMPFIFKAVAAALKANPKVNAAIDGTNIVYKKDINIGMAVALDWGLIVPVIRHADQLNLVGLAKTANDLADRARGKKLSPDEVQGGTFTVTNPGVFGSLFGTPIINQPQVGILGIGAIEKRPVVETDSDGNDLIKIKPMAYFAITYDHRLVDGADADEFMNDVKRTLVEESWSELDPFV
jgi:2-oxoglutarate dehydrogenase E2 component (dihydrolipoamide succinyltransferase)